MATDEKSNEITAVLDLLEVLALKGCIVSADATSCQKQIVQKLNEKDCDYVIGLKDNQPNLRRDTAEYFAAAQKEANLYPEIHHFQTADKGHDGIEVRNYFFTTDIEWLSQRADWPSLNGFGFVRSCITSGDHVSEEVRCSFTSLNDVKLFARAVRAHWGVENSLHWCLDVTFHEDFSRKKFSKNKKLLLTKKSDSSIIINVAEWQYAIVAELAYAHV